MCGHPHRYLCRFEDGRWMRGMERSIYRGILVVSFLFTITKVDSQEQRIDITFDNYDCKSRRLFEDTEYHVKWMGRHNPGCKFIFVADNKDAKLCIETESYKIIDCDVKIKYFGGWAAGILEKIYSCNNSHPETYCGEVYGNIGLQVDGTAISKSRSLPGSFYLKVYASQKYRDGAMIGLSVAGGILGLLIVSCIIVCKRYQSQQGQSVSLSTSTPQKGITSGYNDQDYQSFGGNYETFPKQNSVYLDAEQSVMAKPLSGNLVSREY